MEWLTLWLKKIILLVLLAAFLDLVLPNTNLQKYVKMVMGLMILMTILTPVFSLFQLSPEDLAARLERYQSEWAPDPGGGDWKALSKRILDSRNQEISRYVDEQVQGLVKQQVAAMGRQATAVEVEWEGQQDASGPRIRSIAITIGTQRGVEEDTRTASVRPIQPVHVEVGPAGASPSQREAVPAFQAESDPLYRRIAEAVAREWGLAPERVSVREERGARDSP